MSSEGTSKDTDRLATLSNPAAIAYRAMRDSGWTDDQLDIPSFLAMSGYCEGLVQGDEMKAGRAPVRDVPEEWIYWADEGE